MAYPAYWRAEYLECPIRHTTGYRKGSECRTPLAETVMSYTLGDTSARVKTSRTKFASVYCDEHKDAHRMCLRCWAKLQTLVPSPGFNCVLRVCPCAGRRTRENCVPCDSGNHSNCRICVAPDRECPCGSGFHPEDCDICNFGYCGPCQETDHRPCSACNYTSCSFHSSQRFASLYCHAHRRAHRYCFPCFQANIVPVLHDFTAPKPRYGYFGEPCITASKFRRTAASADVKEAPADQ
jgi:hypothetical protein